MAGLADFSADDVISSDDATPNDVTLAGRGTPAIGASAPQAQAQEASGSVASGSEELPLDSAAIEKAMSQAAPKLKTEGEAVEAEPEVVPEPKKPKLTPAQARIASLIHERNQERERVAQVQAQIMEMQRQQAAQQAQFQAQQLEIEKRRVAMMEAARAEEDESRLSDVEKARRAFLKESKAEALKELSPELQAIRAELESYKAEKAQAIQQAQENERLGQFKQQANTVLEKVLLNGFTPEESKTLGSGMEEMLYSFSGAFGIDPMRAAPVFKEFLARYVNAENARRARTSGPKLVASREAAKPVPANRTGSNSASDVKWPTMAQLRKGDGRTSYDNHVQWIAKGRPALL